MRKILLLMARIYFRYFPIRKGKLPILHLIDKTGLTKNYTLISTFDKNIFINLNLNDWIQKQVFYFGRYEIEKNETLFWRNLIKPGQYVFDLGANIGYYTLQSAVRVENEGKVYCFEPVSTTYKKLIDNIKLNRFNNIVPQNFALSNKKGEIELFVAGENSTGSSSLTMHIDFSGIKEKVQTITLDEYVLNEKIPKVDIIKIDVEGSEPMAIEGMKQIMQNFKPIILIEVLDERLNTVGSSKEKLYELFLQNCYKPYEIISENQLKSLSLPTEGPLILFKHFQTVFPDYIRIIP